MNCPQRIENKGKGKTEVMSTELNKLKKQLNIIMHDAKIRKAYSPGIDQKPAEEYSLEAKSHQRVISPHSAKKSSYPVKSKEDVHQEKKKVQVMNAEVEKKPPTWLNKKTKNENNRLQNKNSSSKYDN